MNWTSLLVVASVTFASQQQPPPARDAVLAPTTGTASVSGVVVNDENPARPVRRAVVVLAGNGLRPSRGAITDDAGRFAFSELPSGQFTITVSRASFITSMYGAKRGGRPGTPISVAEGAPIKDLVVKLWRGAAVAGILRDDTGAPVAGIEVAAIPARSPGSLPTLTNNGVLTNEVGEFRIFGLEAGAYVVAARPAAGGSAQYSSLTDSQTDAALDALRRRTPSGGVSAPAAPVVAPPPEQRSFDYAPVYFPGTPVIGQATPLTLAAGQSQTGLDFSLQRVATAMITGVVTRPDGSPAGGASLQLIAAVPTGPFRSNARAEFNATAAPDGSFRIAQVTPSDYQLVARAPADPKAPGTRPGYIEPPSTPQLYAVTELSITGTDLLGLGLSVNPGVTVSGHFVFESDAQKPPPSLAGMRVTLVPDSVLPIAPGRGFSASALRFPAPAVAKADGTFELSSVAPGRYQLMAGASGVDLTRWQLKSATAGGSDVLDGLIEIFPGSSSSLVITYDDRPTSLSGKLETPSGTPASDVVVIAFAAARELWGPYTRRIKAVRPGVDGSFSIQGLPAGDYVLAAVTDVDPDDWQNPSFLEQLIPAGVPIKLVGGQPVVQTLRIGR